jgi:peptidyl-prolyl cis-trans isomerase C
MSSRLAVLLITLSFAAIASAAPEKAVKPARDLSRMTIARVNGDPISVQEVLDVFNDRHSGHSKFLGGDVELRKFLAIVLDDRLLVQEAYEIGLDQDPLVIATGERTERTRIVATLVKEAIEETARPTDEDIRRAWQALDTIRQVRQITLPTRADAEEVRNAIVHGADIEYFARICSIARSRLNAGHVMVSWGNFPPAWEEAVFPLEPGEVSPVIESSEGFDVVVVENRVVRNLPPLEMVKDDLTSTLYKRRLEARKIEYSRELWSKYHVVPATLPREPRALRDMLAQTPATPVATWDGGGVLTLSDTFNVAELEQLLSVPASAAAKAIDDRIRITVNEPLVARDGKERGLGERPEIAHEVKSAREYTMEALLYRDHILKAIDVEEPELQSYYDSHVAEFKTPPRRQVAQILVSSEAEAAGVKTKLENGSDFAELAQQSSRDFVTAPKGGDLGWITADKVPPAFTEVLSLSAGQISKPIHDTAGWHVIKVLNVEDARVPPYAEVASAVRDRVLDRKKREARAAWVEKLRAASKIEIDDDAIKAFVAANEFDGNAAPPQHGLQ